MKNGWLHCVGAIWILSWAGASAAQDNSAPASNLDVIERAIEAGRFTQAHTMIRRTGQDVNAGGKADLQRLTGQLALAEHDNRLALESFKGLEDKHSADCRVAEGLAVAKLRLNMGRDTLGDLIEVTARCPDRWQAWNALGIAHDLRADWTRSRLAYDSALLLAPKNAEILNNIGFSLILQHRFDEARKLLAKAAKYAPNDPRIQNNIDIADGSAGIPPVIDTRTTTPARTAERLNNAGYAALLQGRRDLARALFAQAVEADDVFARAAAGNLHATEKRP